MAPSTDLVAVTTLILWLGCSQAVLVRADPNSHSTSNPTSGHPLSGVAVAGIVVGSAAGGFLFAVILGLLIWCLCQRRKVSSNQEKPGSNAGLNGSVAPAIAKPPRSARVWSFFPHKQALPLTSPRLVSSQRVPVPLFQHSDKWGEDEFSDASFVLPELGGPNPHNKFDGMEWVDIKGMDDDVLVDISTDLRKYQQHQRL